MKLGFKMIACILCLPHTNITKLFPSFKEGAVASLGIFEPATT